jgi:hypothetical protein
VLICCALAISALDGAVPIASAQDNKSAAQGLPANYRQMMAKYITDTYIVPRLRFPIRDVKISQPHARSGGLFSSSVVPAVCVILYRDNPLGQIVDENFVMTVEKGRVRQLPTINVDSCPGYSKFHELLGR